MSVRIRIEDRETREYLSGVIEGLSRLDELVKYNLEEGMKMAEGLAQVYAPVIRGLYRDSIHIEETGPNSMTLVADVVDPDSGFGYAPSVEERHGTLSIAISEAFPYIISGAVQDIRGIFVKEEQFLNRGKIQTRLRDIPTGQFVRRK